MRFEAVVIGLSAGGVEVLLKVIPSLPPDFPLPVMVCLHVGTKPSSLAELLQGRSAIRVKEADPLEPLRPGTVYLAPAGYHLYVEADRTLSLSVDEAVRHACPSIDVLFESASDVFRDRLLGVLMTGASADGAAGLARIKARGGFVVVQDPDTAAARAMPDAALALVRADRLVTPETLASALQELAKF